jgi:site-specific recombinase XerD
MVHDSYVDQVVARVETKMLLRGLAPHTVATYIPCVRRFIGWVGKPLGAVKSRDVEQYLLDMVLRDRSPRTRDVNLAAIRFALRAWLGRDPCREIRPAKVRRHSPEILSGSEVSLSFANRSSGRRAEADSGWPAGSTWCSRVGPRGRRSVSSWSG